MFFSQSTSSALRISSDSRQYRIYGMQNKITLIKIILYKYNILERVLVENIIPRNVIINRGAAEVDNHISRDDFFD